MYKDRLKEYLKLKKQSIREFERVCGLGNGVASRISPTTNPSTLRKISEATDLNLDWLLTGEGSMLKGGSAAPDMAMDEDGIEDESSENAEDLVPLLPVEAMAGTLQGLAEGIELSLCRKIKAPVKGADWAIQISGDSMEPDYKNGSYLFIRKMHGSMIPWGQTMVVDTYDGVVVKNIFPFDQDYIEARSINPKYPPFQIRKGLIIGLYRVLGGTFINSTI